MKAVLLCLAACLLTVACIDMKYECAITGPDHTNGWDGDLGVPFLFNGRMYFLEGDVLHQNHARIPNAIGFCTDMANCRVQWNEVPGGWPYPFYYLLGQSTVPAGAIEIDGRAYIFMMNVINWGNGIPGSVVADSMGIVGIPPTPFAATSVKFGVNSRFVNIAPVLSPDRSTVYFFGSGLYRAAPISLARVSPPSLIGDFGAWEYFVGMDSNNQPIFSHDYNECGELIWTLCGELGATWSTYLQHYVITWMDDDLGLLILAKAPHAWGPWDTSTVLFNSLLTPFYSWIQPGWYGAYGGYIVPDGGSRSPIAYITLSLWVPYRVFILSVDLSQVTPTIVGVQDLKSGQNITLTGNPLSVN